MSTNVVTVSNVRVTPSTGHVYRSRNCVHQSRNTCLPSRHTCLESLAAAYHDVHLLYSCPLGSETFPCKVVEFGLPVVCCFLKQCPAPSSVFALPRKVIVKLKPKSHLTHTGCTAHSPKAAAVPSVPPLPRTRPVEAALL